MWYHFLLQEFFPTQGSSSCVLHYRLILYHWAPWEAPYSMYMLVYSWLVVHVTSVNEMLLKIFKKNTLFRSVLGLQQNSEDDTEISHMLLCMHSLPPYQYHSPEWCFFFLVHYTNTHTHTQTHTHTENEPTLTHNQPKSMIYPLALGFTLGVFYSVSLDKCIMTCIHHYNITQTIFMILQK